MIPNLFVLRPADFFETKKSIEIALKLKKPTALILTRQKVLNLFEYQDIIEKNLHRGIYILEDNKSKNLIIASGSEVGLAIEVCRSLKENGIKIDLASAPSTDLFMIQEESYKDSIKKYERIFIIEAANSTGWSDILNKKVYLFDIKRFGESGKEKDLFNYFGFSKEKIAKEILELIIND